MRIALVGLAVAILLAGCASPPQAQSPYADRISHAIAGLTPEQVDDLRNAQGMGYALPAELNGYPGPRHVLDLADDLRLDDRQRQAMQALFERMEAAAIQAGEEVIAAHAALDALFESRNATAESVLALSLELGEAEATLRAIHLAAHLETLEIMSSEQAHRYAQLRGYAGEGGHADHGH